MPGSIIVRPIEANLTHSTELIGKMNPYCTFNVGGAKIKSQVCKKGGKHPVWGDAVTLPLTHESKILVEVMDKDKLTRDDNIGTCTLDLQEVQATGQVSKWYPLYYKNKVAGEILLEAVFQPGTGYGQGQQQFAGSQYAGSQYAGAGAGMISGQNYGQEHLHGAGAGFVQQEVLVNDTSRHSNVWTEQRQVVENRTFMKEVDVVETRATMQDVEVMEPVRVLKDVQYTQAVPVRQQIEVVEPQVVVKDVEVIEPRLVTKTIQVVENVPVKRQVEVIEMRNTIQEVHTYEPQTFTKQVEVTEFQPVRRQVEVTQPVTVKKAVEYVEPVITTQYITKELQQPVIIDQKFTTEVGPASIIGWTNEYIVKEFGNLSLTTDYQRLGGHQRWVGYETIFTGLTDQERLWEQQRLSRLNEQEWLAERQRLMGFNERDRLTHQRSFFDKIKSALGMGPKTHQGMGTGNMMNQGLGHTSNYHASPNF